MERRLSDLLARLPIPGLIESNNRHTIASILSELLSIPFLPKQIKLKEGVLTLQTPPIVKSAILIRTEEIINTLSKEGIAVTKIY